MEGTYALLAPTTDGGTHRQPCSGGGVGDSMFHPLVELAVHLYRIGPLSSRHGKVTVGGGGRDGDASDGWWRPPSLVRRGNVGLPDEGGGVGGAVMFERRPMEPNTGAATATTARVAEG